MFKKLGVSFLIVAICSNVFSQTFNSAGEYMSYITDEYNKVTVEMWDYTAAVGHGKTARKIENRRKDLLNATKIAKTKIARMSAYKDDATLRDTMVSFLDLSYTVLNKDYEKIVDMEEIAEQSYDMMEAYLLAQERANDKLDIANDKLIETQKQFAAKNDITLVENKSKIERKLESAGKVMNYYNVIYLIFFKSYKQEAYLLEALNKNDVNAIEQNRNSIIKFANEGLSKLDTIKAFKSDMSIKSSCADMLRFYINEAQNGIPIITDYYLKKDNFEKIKTAVESKSEMARTKDDIENYNKAVNDFNASVNKYNTTNQNLNKQRNSLLDRWNKTAQDFLDKHTPKKR